MEKYIVLHKIKLNQQLQEQLYILFLISSAYGNFKEVAALRPVVNLTADDLLKIVNPNIHVL